MNKKLVIIMILTVVVMTAVFYVLYTGGQNQQKSGKAELTTRDKESAQYDLDFNCNLKNIPGQFIEECKNYIDSRLLNENCFSSDMEQEFEARCSAYLCAQKKNVGMSCE